MSSGRIKEWFSKHALASLSIVSVAIVVITAILFGWGRLYIWNAPLYTLDHEVVGTFGDFIGGFLGSVYGLFSVVLMYWTF